MILLIDNYDSFVHNLGRYVNLLGYKTLIVRNDMLSLDDILRFNPQKIILSPGPCRPNQAGISLAVIKHFSGHLPILGVCLGHQAIGQAYGGKVIRANMPMHGKSTDIYHNQRGLFSGLPSPLKVGRYHSLILDKDSLPTSLTITSESETREIMSIQHKKWPTYGVQFHPESIITDHGFELLKNFLLV